MEKSSWKTAEKHTTKFRTKSSVNFEKNLFSRDTRSLVSHQEPGRCWLFNRDGLVTVCAVEIHLDDTPR